MKRVKSGLNKRNRKCAKGNKYTVGKTRAGVGGRKKTG